MKFEEVLGTLRAGKKVRRVAWDKDNAVSWERGRIIRHGSVTTRHMFETLLEDWEIVREPKRMANYLCPLPGRYPGPFGYTTIYYKATFEVGTQPEGAVLIQGSEKEVAE